MTKSIVEKVAQRHFEESIRSSTWSPTSFILLVLVLLEALAMALVFYYAL